ncbi:MAG: hypothetical protein Ta2A_05490 [Treponemataceae bacterium]|nr:MAG: hypothetical protein Ta2A_05490 [Treponemataceae bacterium]
MWEAISECHWKLNIIQNVLSAVLFGFLILDNRAIEYLGNIFVASAIIKDVKDIAETVAFILGIASILFIRILFTLGAILKYWHNKL